MENWKASAREMCDLMNRTVCLINTQFQMPVLSAVPTDSV